MEGMQQTDSGGDGSFDLTQFYQVFFEEASENLSNMETLLLDLDPAAADGEQLNAIFRCAHSIKGGAATFGFKDVADLTHVMETLLDRLRRRELAVTSGMVDVLLGSGDTLRSLLAHHQGTTEEVIDATELVAQIRALAELPAAPLGAPPVAVQAASMQAAPTPASLAQAAPVRAAPAAQPPAAQAQPVRPPVQLQPEAATSPADGERVVVLGPLDNGEQADGIVSLFAEIAGLGTIEPLPSAADDPRLRCFRVVSSSSNSDLLDLFTFHVSREQVRFEDAAAPAVPVTAAPAAPVASAARAPATAPAAKDEGFGFFVDLPAGSAGAAAGAQGPASGGAAAAAPAIPQAVRVAAAPVAHGGGRADKPAAAVESATLRVSVEKVDQLINLVGELVITQAMLAQTGRSLDPMVHQQLVSSLVDLERNTRQLQESVMAIRMIPMAVVFNRFPRMLRDLANKLGKQVELHTEGEATELDKGMVEKITDPLTHLVRNALDHGIEMPDVREAAGKQAAGSITLSAQHRGGAIAIEVRDDGRGLNRDKILAKARERGLPVGDNMSDQDVWQLIFEPGFSTADTVTDVSGRGVGMDVVRRNILGLGGTVELDSALGYGTRVTVKLPLTLAIMDGMSVGVAEETYILPLASVIESIQLDGEEIRRIAGANQVIEVRGQYLPVVALDEVFSVPRFDKRSSGILIVIESEGARVALMVDELIGQQQVVVKNLEANYRKVPGISGATILGDGRVALILDIAHLIKRTRH